MQNKTLETQIMEQRAKARKTKMAKLRDAAQRYNALAEQLAPVIEELWRLRAELAEPPEGKVVHFPCGITGALESVPRAFLPGEEGFIDASDPCKFYFFCRPITGGKNRLARLQGWLPSVLGPGIAS